MATFLLFYRKIKNVQQYQYLISPFSFVPHVVLPPCLPMSYERCLHQGGSQNKVNLKIQATFKFLHSPPFQFVNKLSFCRCMVALPIKQSKRIAMSTLSSYLQFWNIIPFVLYSNRPFLVSEFCFIWNGSISKFLNILCLYHISSLTDHALQSAPFNSAILGFSSRLEMERLMFNFSLRCFCSFQELF